jgi:hypothetical protein
MNQVSRDIQNAIPRHFDIDAELNNNFNAAAHAGRGGAYGRHISQSISITTPRALSERELAREFRNLNRKLALGAV